MFSVPGGVCSTSVKVSVGVSVRVSVEVSVRVSVMKCSVEEGWDKHPLGLKTYVVREDRIRR